MAQAKTVIPSQVCRNALDTVPVFIRSDIANVRCSPNRLSKSYQEIMTEECQHFKPKQLHLYDGQQM